jgi:hypothetical protein
MYMAMGKMVCGLIIYRCLRGSSALEGYHAHLRRLLEHCYSASDKTRDAIVNCFDFRFNVRAARAASLFDPGVKHFNMQLLDEIDHLLLALGLQGLELHHQVADKPALMVHGSHFSVLALAREGKKIDAAAAGGDEQLCAKKWKLVPSSADKAALIAHGCFQGGSASELCAVAQSRHILWDDDDAERFKQAVALGEAKQAELARVGFPDLHEAQRVPATAPAALMVPAAAAVPVPAECALMPLAAPIQSAGADVVGAPRHDPVPRAIGPALPPRLLVGPVQPAAAAVSALEAAAAAVAASAAAVAAEQQQQQQQQQQQPGGRAGEERQRKRSGAGAPRKHGGSAEQEAKREKQRLWTATCRAKAKSKLQRKNENSSAAAPE